MTQWGNITLWDAAATGDLEMCKKRMAASWTKIDAKDSQGRTALHEACRYGHLDIVKFLKEKGAKTDVTTVDGTTSLHLAALNGHDEVVEYLVSEVKLDIDARDKYGDTSLMAASGNDKVSTVKLLLRLGANKKFVNLNKRTAEEMAASAAITEAFSEATYVSPTKY